MCGFLLGWFLFFLFWFGFLGGVVVCFFVFVGFCLFCFVFIVALFLYLILSFFLYSKFVDSLIFPLLAVQAVPGSTDQAWHLGCIKPSGKLAAEGRNGSVCSQQMF